MKDKIDISEDNHIQKPLAIWDQSLNKKQATVLHLNIPDKGGQWFDWKLC